MPEEPPAAHNDRPAGDAGVPAATLSRTGETARRLVYDCVLERRSVVLGFMGARYCGKSHFVRVCTAGLAADRIPHARVDAVRANAALLDRLADIVVEEFTDAPSALGRVRFPRYLLARLVLALSVPARAPRAELRERVVNILGTTWAADNLPATIGALAGAVTAMLNVPGASNIRDGATKVLGAVFAGERARTVIQRPGARFFADNPLLDRANSAAGGLTRLWEWRHGTDPQLRHRADRVLVAALRADLRASAEAAGWGGNYALLVDNADDNRAAAELVGILATDMDDDDRLTVIATHRGRLLSTIGAPMGGNAVIDPAHVRPDEVSPPPPGTHWWPLRIPNHGEDDIREALRDGAEWSEIARYRTAKAVHRLTRGHPGSARDLCEALTTGAEPADGHVDLRDVIDAHGLKRQLTGGMSDTAMRHLVTCAAVRDRDHVDAVLALMDVDQVSRTAVMRSELWVPGRAQRLVLLPVLRRLLLDDLAARADGAADGWDAVFGHLVNHAHDSGDDESELYYRLALGQTRTVTERLAERLADDEPAMWISLHKHVTLAPGRFGGDTDEQALARHRSWADGAPLARLTLADLVVRLWLAADALRPPPTDAGIHSDYTTLAVTTSAAAAHLYVEAARWPSPDDLGNPSAGGDGHG